MLKTVVAAAGGQSAFARLVGASQQEVWNWLNGRPVPVRRCAAIEAATGGAVTRRDLRPDDWHLIWPELADDSTQPTPAPAAQGGAHV